MSTRTKVLLVDYADVNPGLRSVVEQETSLRVVAVVRDPAQVLAVLRRETPDVVVVQVRSASDVAMVAEIMGFHPVPVLALSAGDDASSTLAMEAMVAGAADVLPDPGQRDAAAARALHRQLRTLRGVHVVRHQRARLPSRPATRRRGVPIVAIAASTGGPPAIATVLAGLLNIEAALLVVQHLHREFVSGFVDWLVQDTKMPIRLARDGEGLEAGRALVAPADVHLTVSSAGTIVLRDQPKRLHQPSADELFGSVAEVAANRAVGVMLTGMGADGAEGLLQMRRKGAVTVAQDQATSAVFGMPGAAVALGAATKVLPLDEIAEFVTSTVARL